MIEQYNAKMGGVDLSDRTISYYRIGARTRKWTVHTMMHFIDLCIVNSWIQYRLDKKELNVARKNILDCLVFRMAIGEAILSAIRDTSSSDSSDRAC